MGYTTTARSPARQRSSGQEAGLRISTKKDCCLWANPETPPALAGISGIVDPSKHPDLPTSPCQTSGSTHKPMSSIRICPQEEQFPRRLPFRQHSAKPQLPPSQQKGARPHRDERLAFRSATTPQRRTPSSKALGKHQVDHPGPYRYFLRPLRRWSRSRACTTRSSSSCSACRCPRRRPGCRRR